LVVANNKVVAKVRWLDQAKRALNKYKRGSRCIFETKGKKVLLNARKIAGYPQTKQYGFNRFWKNWPDIRRMHKIAVRYYTPKSKSKATSKKKRTRVIRTKNIRGTFLVVSNGKVVRKSSSLNSAKSYLAKFKRGPRCIFEVKRGVVRSNARKIAGYPQTAKYGFKTYWGGRKNFRKMYLSAFWYYKRWTKKYRKYVVVAGNKVVGTYSSLKKAKSKLARFNKKSKTLRCIFKSLKGRVSKHPFRTGNRYYRNKADIKGMYLIAQKYSHPRLRRVRKYRVRKRSS